MAQEKDLAKRQIVISSVSRLYDKVLNIYTTQYEKFSEDLKKMVNIPNKAEILIPDFDRDDLPSISTLLEGDEEVKLESENIIAEIIKLSPRKR